MRFITQRTATHLCIFPSPAPFFILFFSLWGCSRGFFGGVWKRRGFEMCTFRVLGLSCEGPAAPSFEKKHTHTTQHRPPGFHRTTRGRKQAHLRSQPTKTRPKFHEKTSRREKKRHENIPREKKRMKWRREKKKKREILGSPTEGGPTEGGPAEGGPKRGGGPLAKIGPSCQIKVVAKVSLVAKVGLVVAKVGLAKVGRGQRRSWPK